MKNLRPYNVGILGATGSVGQRLLQRLAGHPWFRVTALGASERSVGRTYGEAVTWGVSADPPAEYRALPVVPCDPEAMTSCDLVLSGLDTAAAFEIEPRFTATGMAVISNSSAYREHPRVPLLIPEVNARHLSLLDGARGEPHGPGLLVTNPNCSVTGLAMALAPLHQEFGVQRGIVTTLQAVSGAGMSGPSCMQMLDNVIPFIAGEEEKMERELSKLFGTNITLSAHCHRVQTLDGHLEAVSVELGRSATPEEAIEAFRAFRGEVAELHLPSSPDRLLVVRDEPDRPQPRLDRDTGNGMSVTLGRVRVCPVLGLKFELLSHNTLRGAAGGTVLNAELLAARNLIPRRGSS